VTKAELEAAIGKAGVTADAVAKAVIQAGQNRDRLRLATRSRSHEATIRKSI
jgi:hypothetical protein